MSDKKNEDFVVRMPDNEDGFSVEKDPFLRKSSPQRTSHRESLLQQFYAKIDNSPPASIIAYCLSSISMTVVNKYVVSGTFWNLNFLYLAIQVCVTLNLSPRFSCAARNKTDMLGSLVYRVHRCDHDLQAARRHHYARSF